MSQTSADVVVVGLGIHGSAAAASLARRGHRVVGVEQFTPGHSRGSSHGRTRMTRRAYPNPVWNDLVARAHDAWDALERESGEVLLHRTGGLYAHRGHAQLQGPDCVVIEDAAEMTARMPAFRAPDGYRAVYDPSAGVLEAGTAWAALQRIARTHGADLRFGEQMLGWDTTSDGVVVRTASGSIRARRLVLTVGSWVRAVVPQIAAMTEIWRILTLTVAPGQAAGMPPALGAFSVDRPEGLVFGIPDAAGNGLKIGVDAGEIWDPQHPVAPPTAAEVDELRALMATYVPAIDTTPVEAAACLYTMSDDRRFLLGSPAGTPEVIVASACSGHGFKFGPAIGDALADLAEDLPRPDLDFVSLSRRGL